ncbi:MAG: hypothetical protein EP343_16180 [Deltaproteobacteria bacterium]|nr:MAG: hypothetical protein EP343_16180 [Deltaproteobacteria bacterium]
MGRFWMRLGTLLFLVVCFSGCGSAYISDNPAPDSWGGGAESFADAGGSELVETKAPERSLEGCTRACFQGSHCCDATCVDILKDPTNCGQCRRRCPQGAECWSGQCIFRCHPLQTLCGETCASLDTDPKHCGECGKPCTSGFRCVSGECIECTSNAECLSGYTCRRGRCRRGDCQSDADCPGGQRCLESWGRCIVEDSIP